MFEILRSQNGGFFWRLKESQNSEILCHSETYTSKAAAENGIAAVRRIAPGAPINDRT